MNTTNKPGVLAVMDAATMSMDDEQGDELREARATVERLAEAAEAVIRSPRRPPSIEARQNLAAALAAFWGEQP